MKKGIIYAFLAALLFGLTTVVAAQGVKLVNPLLFLAFDSLIAIPLLFHIAYASKTKLFIRDCLRNARRDTAELALFMGLLGNYLVVFGLSLTMASRAGFLVASEPVFVALMAALFFGSRLGKKGALLVALVVFGSYVLITGGNPALLTSSYSYGDLLILLGVVFYAYSYFPSKRICEKFGSFTASILANVAGALPLPVFLLFFWDQMPAVIANFHYILAVSIMAPVLGYYFQFRSLETTDSWKAASIITPMAAVVTAVVSYIWMGDALSPVQLLGGAIIVGSSYLISLQR